MRLWGPTLRKMREGWATRRLGCVGGVKILR
jgi:hypothetical protein